MIIIDSLLEKLNIEKDLHDLFEKLIYNLLDENGGLPHIDIITSNIIILTKVIEHFGVKNIKIVDKPLEQFNSIKIPCEQIQDLSIYGIDSVGYVNNIIFEEIKKLKAPFKKLLIYRLFDKIEDSGFSIYFSSYVRIQTLTEERLEKLKSII